MTNIFFYETDIGEIAISENGNAITNLYFQGEDTPQDVVVYETELLKEASKQLKSYLSRGRKDFALPLAPSGTMFMLRVWENLRDIPYGETRSYQEVAKCMGNVKASQAVGQANNRNPIPIFIPCHRVIGANGKLTGYRGGLKIKAYLLKLEKQNGKFINMVEKTELSAKEG